MPLLRPIPRRISGGSGTPPCHGEAAGQMRLCPARLETLAPAILAPVACLPSSLAAPPSVALTLPTPLLQNLLSKRSPAACHEPTPEHKLTYSPCLRRQLSFALWSPYGCSRVALARSGGRPAKGSHPGLPPNGEARVDARCCFQRFSSDSAAAHGCEMDSSHDGGHTRIALFLDSEASRPHRLAHHSTHTSALLLGHTSPCLSPPNTAIVSRLYRVVSYTHTLTLIQQPLQAR